jgi:hypothetical protein
MSQQERGDRVRRLFVREVTDAGQVLDPGSITEWQERDHLGRARA